MFLKLFDQSSLITGHPVCIWQFYPEIKSLECCHLSGALSRDGPGSPTAEVPKFLCGPQFPLYSELGLSWFQCISFFVQGLKKPCSSGLIGFV